MDIGVSITVDFPAGAVLVVVRARRLDRVGWGCGRRGRGHGGLDRRGRGMSDRLLLDMEIC